MASIAEDALLIPLAGECHTMVIAPGLILQRNFARRVSVPAAPGAKNAISCAVGAETHRAKA